MVLQDLKEISEPPYYFSIIHNNQEWEQLSVYQWWIDKENVIFTNNGILFSHEKKDILLFVTIGWSQMDGYWGHYEVSHKKDKHCMISFTHEIQKSQTQRNKD